MSVSFQTSNLALPDQGSAVIAVALNFTATANVALDLTQDIELGKLDFVQSCYVDNADNSTSMDLIFSGGPLPYRIRVQPNFQGWFPISIPKGAVRLTALSNSGAIINVQFSNFAMPYYISGPAQGIAVVPPLTNLALQPLNFPGAASELLVGGVAAQTVKLYRGIFNVDQPAILKFQDGNGGPTLFSADLAAGGSLTFQVSGVPWFNTSAGNGLYLNSSAACNVYGGFSYVQS